MGGGASKEIPPEARLFGDAPIIKPPIASAGAVRFLDEKPASRRLSGDFTHSGKRLSGSNRHEQTAGASKGIAALGGGGGGGRQSDKNLGGTKPTGDADALAQATWHRIIEYTRDARAERGDLVQLKCGTCGGEVGSCGHEVESYHDSDSGASSRRNSIYKGSREPSFHENNPRLASFSASRKGGSFHRASSFRKGSFNGTDEASVSRRGSFKANGVEASVSRRGSFDATSSSKRNIEDTTPRRRTSFGLQQASSFGRKPSFGRRGSWNVGQQDSRPPSSHLTSSRIRETKLGDAGHEMASVVEAVDLLLQSAALERRGWSYVPAAEEMYQKAQEKRRKGLDSKGKDNPLSALLAKGNLKDAKSLQHAISDMKDGKGKRIMEEGGDDEMSTIHEEEHDVCDSPVSRAHEHAPEVTIDLVARTEKSITVCWDQTPEARRYLQSLKTVHHQMSPRNTSKRNLDDNEGDIARVTYDLVYRPKPNAKSNNQSNLGATMTSTMGNSAGVDKQVIPWSFAAYKLKDSKLTIDDLLSNTLYEFKCKRSGLGQYGPVACARTAPSVPSAPQDLIPQEVTADSIMVGWQPVKRDNGLPVLDYVVMMKAWGGEMRQVYEGRSRFYLAHELSANVVHIIEVFARNRLGLSKSCARLAVRTLSTGAAKMTPWEAHISPETYKLFYVHQKGKETAWVLPEGALLDETASFRNKRQFITGEVQKNMKNAREKMDRPEYFPHVEVSRENILYESLVALKKFSRIELIGGPLRVRFKGEEGIDAGGLAKDWFTEASKALIDSPLGLMQMGESGLVSIDPRACVMHEGADIEWLFRCVGIFLAKAVMDSQTTGLLFSPPLLTLLVGEQPSIEDLKTVEPAVVAGLQWVTENDVTDADLTFTASFDAFGIAQVVELVNNGAEVNVTETNKNEYADLMRNWIARGRYEPAITHMIAGFQEYLPPKYAKHLTTKELQSLIGGQIDIEVSDIRRDFKLTGGYDVRSDVVVWFWSLLESWDLETLSKLLTFVTGCSSVPVTGLQPPLTITQMHVEIPAEEPQQTPSAAQDPYEGIYYQDGYYYNQDGSLHGYYTEDGHYIYCNDEPVGHAGATAYGAAAASADAQASAASAAKHGYHSSPRRDKEMKDKHQNKIDHTLPRAHTCFNQLVLPKYSSMKILTEQLTYALDNTDAGFYMS
jgi:hypothetical protein